MTRWLVRTAAVASMALAGTGPSHGGDKKIGKLERIEAQVAQELPKGDKTVLFTAPTPGMNLYWHVKPMEHKVKLLKDGKEVDITAFKVKDRVYFFIDKKANIITEVHLGRGGKAKTTADSSELVASKTGVA